jgi:hypothetical protein
VVSVIDMMKGGSHKLNVIDQIDDNVTPDKKGCKC